MGNSQALILALTDRHIRTPEGSRKYGGPIGSVIRKDLPGSNLAAKISRMSINKSKASTTPKYVTTKDGQKWTQNKDGDWETNGPGWTGGAPGSSPKKTITDSVFQSLAKPKSGESPKTPDNSQVIRTLEEKIQPLEYKLADLDNEDTVDFTGAQRAAWNRKRNSLLLKIDKLAAALDAQAKQQHGPKAGWSRGAGLYDPAKSKAVLKARPTEKFTLRLKPLSAGKSNSAAPKVFGRAQLQAQVDRLFEAVNRPGLSKASRTAIQGRLDAAQRQLDLLSGEK